MYSNWMCVEESDEKIEIYKYNKWEKDINLQMY